MPENGDKKGSGGKESFNSHSIQGVAIMTPCLRHQRKLQGGKKKLTTGEKIARGRGLERFSFILMSGPVLELNQEKPVGKKGVAPSTLSRR